MNRRTKILLSAAVAVLVITGILTFVLIRNHPKPKTKPVAASCSLLSPAMATKLLGTGTHLRQAKTAKVEYVNVTGCQYDSKDGQKSIVIGQRVAPTNYGQQTLKQSFFSNVSQGEAQIRFAGYAGFTFPNQPGYIRLWFKNTWLNVFSPSQKMSEEILTNFVKNH